MSSPILRQPTVQTLPPPGFFKKHRTGCLALAAIAAVVASIALAILCWPAAFAVVGALLPGSISTALAGLSLALKITTVAAPIVFTIALWAIFRRGNPPPREVAAFNWDTIFNETIDFGRERDLLNDRIKEAANMLSTQGSATVSIEDKSGLENPHSSLVKLLQKTTCEENWLIHSKNTAWLASQNTNHPYHLGHFDLTCTQKSLQVKDDQVSATFYFRGVVRSGVKDNTILQENFMCNCVYGKNQQGNYEYLQQPTWTLDRGGEQGLAFSRNR